MRVLEVFGGLAREFGGRQVVLLAVVLLGDGMDMRRLVVKLGGLGVVFVVRTIVVA